MTGRSHLATFDQRLANESEYPGIGCDSLNVNQNKKKVFPVHSIETALIFQIEESNGRMFLIVIN